MGSGMGKTSTRGHKGQWSRSGARLIRGFEGGQMPLHRRLPKRGFTNIFREEYDVVNLDRLATLGETEITPEVLKKAGVVNGRQPVKILGNGELKQAITVHAHKFSKTGRKKISQWTRYLTVVLSAVQSFGIAISLQKAGHFVTNPGPGFILMTMLTLTTGSAFIMWLGEQITERGIGNGMSLLIFAGIVVGLPRGGIDLCR